MEFLKDHIADSNQAKIRISDIFEENNSDIEKINNNVPKGFALKSYWSDIVNDLKKECPATQIVCDLYLIDFEEYELKRQMYENKINFKKSIVKEHTDEIDKLFNPSASSQTPCLSNIIYIKRFDSQKATLKHEPDYSKKDLLYYDIVDLDIINKNKSINKVLDQEEKNKFSKIYQGKFNDSKSVIEIAASVFQNDNNLELKALLKQKKNGSRSMEAGEMKEIIKRVVKVMKVFQHTIKQYNSYNENEFTFLFLYPLLSQVLKNNNVVMKLGEPHLQCATKHTNDESRAVAGPKIDIILSSEMLALEISIIEVSGAIGKVDKTHFLGDRNKIAKNLRAIHKQIENVTTTPNLTSLKKVKLFGLQAYLNTIYVYSLSKASNHYYVFVLEKKIKIPTRLTLFKQQIPTFLGRIWCLTDMLKQSIECIEHFLRMSSAEEYVSSDSNMSSLRLSPRKKQRTR